VSLVGLRLGNASFQVRNLLQNVPVHLVLVFFSHAGERTACCVVQAFQPMQTFCRRPHQGRSHLQGAHGLQVAAELVKLLKLQLQSAPCLDATAPFVCTRNPIGRRQSRQFSHYLASHCLASHRLASRRLAIYRATFAANMYVNRMLLLFVGLFLAASKRAVRNLGFKVIKHRVKLRHL